MSAQQALSPGCHVLEDGGGPLESPGPKVGAGEIKNLGPSASACPGEICLQVYAHGP